MTSFDRRWVILGAVISVILAALLVLADALSLPVSVINGFLLVVSIVTYAVIGMACRTTQPDEYYVAGRRIAALPNGMATAADWMSAASFIGLTGLLMSEGYLGDGSRAGGLAYVLGWTGGFCLLGLLFARQINSSGAITIPQMLGDLFDSLWLRRCAAIGAIICSAIYLVAQIYGIGLVASMLSGLTFELGVFMALGGILLCSFLGGMRAVTWTQLVQCLVLVLTMLTIAVAVAWKTHGHPIVPLAASEAMVRVSKLAAEIDVDPLEQSTREMMKIRLEDLNLKIADPVQAREIERERLLRQISLMKSENAPLRDIHRLESSPVLRDVDIQHLVSAWMRERNQIQDALRRPIGFEGRAEAGNYPRLANTLALVFCLILGTAGLPHILARSFTTPTPTQAQRSVAWAMFFIVLVYITASALAVLLKHSVLTDLVGARLDALPEWADQLKLRKLGLLKLHDWNGDGRLQWGDIQMGSDLIMLAAPDIVHISPLFTGLIAAGALAAALSTADGLLLTISNSLAHDLSPPSGRDALNPLRRVMLSKLLLMVVALLAALVATYRPVDILFWVACAFSLAASTFFPVMLLGLHWPGMSRMGAILGMLSGMAMSTYYIFINHPWVQTRLGLSPEMTSWWGLEAYSAAVFGVPISLVAGILGSWVWPSIGHRPKAL
ncbi:MAG: VC_2705 family sodium/solute symporter [Alphaproteobacteria bacterium]|nr:VC_2705 family sodium/solute symporter [Alphaproteobacteria bacterium]